MSLRDDYDGDDKRYERGRAILGAWECLTWHWIPEEKKFGYWCERYHQPISTLNQEGGCRGLRAYQSPPVPKTPEQEAEDNKKVVEIFKRMGWAKEKK